MSPKILLLSKTRTSGVKLSLLCKGQKRKNCKKHLLFVHEGNAKKAQNPFKLSITINHSILYYITEKRTSNRLKSDLKWPTDHVFETPDLQQVKPC